MAQTFPLLACRLLGFSGGAPLEPGISRICCLTHSRGHCLEYRWCTMFLFDTRAILTKLTFAILMFHQLLLLSCWCCSICISCARDMKCRSGRFRLLLLCTCAFPIEKRSMAVRHAVAIAPHWIYLLAVGFLHEEMVLCGMLANTWSG